MGGEGGEKGEGECASKNVDSGGEQLMSITLDHSYCGDNVFEMGEVYMEEVEEEEEGDVPGEGEEPPLLPGPPLGVPHVVAMLEEQRGWRRPHPSVGEARRARRRSEGEVEQLVRHMEHLARVDRVRVRQGQPAVEKVVALRWVLCQASKVGLQGLFLEVGAHTSYLHLKQHTVLALNWRGFLHLTPDTSN